MSSTDRPASARRGRRAGASPRRRAARALSAGLLACACTGSPDPASAPTAQGDDSSTAIASPSQSAVAWIAPRERDLLTADAAIFGGSGGAAVQAMAWQESRPDDAEQLMKIARQPAAEWLGAWSGEIGRAMEQRTRTAAQQGAIPVLVVYNIPERDCGLYSAGGALSPEAYRDWIDRLAAGVGDNPAALILEPDAIGHVDCLSAESRQIRFELLNHAVDAFEALPRAAVYIDAGHSDWMTVNQAAERLIEAGVARARGFALNVSNYQFTEDLVAYGTAISESIGGDPPPHFVIDTSRNGNGPWPPEEDPTGESWCNPPGRALGQPPTTDPGVPLVDAYLWVKHPGQSDGDCRGGPQAGEWWAEYALGLAQRADW